MSTKANVAQLAMSEHATHARTLREIISGLLQDSKLTLDEHKMACEQLNENRGNPSEEAVLIPWKKDLEQALRDIRKRRAEVETELREHLRKKPKQLDALHNQVGDFGTSGTCSTAASNHCNAPRGRTVTVSVGNKSTNASVLTTDVHGNSNEQAIDVDGGNADTGEEDEDEEDEESTGSQISREEDRIRHNAKHGK